MSNLDTSTQLELERRLAAQYNQQVWDLLSGEHRTEQDDAAMVHAAHCSYLYWLNAGNELNHQRGAWLLARVYAEVGDGSLALYYARECDRLTRENRALMQDFDLAYAKEALARANAVVGNLAEAERNYRLALQAAEQVQDQSDKQLVLSDVAGGAWGGFRVTA